MSKKKEALDKPSKEVYEIEEESKDLALLKNYFQGHMDQYLGCGPLSENLSEELEKETGIDRDSPIFILALFVHYHLSITTDPQQLAYLYH